MVTFFGVDHFHIYIVSLGRGMACDDDGSNSFQRNDVPLICAVEEKICCDKIRLGLVS